MNTKYLLAVILVLAGIIIYLSLRTPKRPESGNTDAVKHTIDSLVSVNTRLEQDALKQSLLIREGVRKQDSIETLFLRQNGDIEKIKGKYVRLIEAVKAGDAAKQMEILKEHLK
jgi:hypothetical protein